MEIWLDTLNVDLILEMKNLGIVAGVTTNPTILSSSQIPPQEGIKKLLDIQEGRVAVQVLSVDFEEILKEARSLAAFSPRILVKIPATQNGMRAIYVLNQEGVSTLATAIFEVRQALLAFKAGACYLAPYLGRMTDLGMNPLELVAQMQAIKMRYGFQGKVMGAGIREAAWAMGCVDIGICAVTLPDKVLMQLVQSSEPTLLALDKFAEDWSKSPFNQEYHRWIHR